MRQQLVQLLYGVSISSDLDSGNVELAERLILNAVLDGLEIGRAGIWLLNEENTAIECRLLLDRENGKEIQMLVLPRDAYPAYFKALDTQRTITAEDAHTDPATYEFSESYLTPLNIGAMLDAPIRYKGKMIGIFCCEHIGGTRQWTEDECSFIGALADLYGRALSAQENERINAELERANQHLEQRVAERTRTLEKTLSELTAMQEKLIEAEKMASLGNLVAGIAHEVNTPIGIAVTANSSAKDKLNTLNKHIDSNTLTKATLLEGMNHLNECIKISFTNLERAAKLISDFKQTAVDQSSLNLLETNIKDYFENILHSLMPLTRSHNVEVNINCVDDFSLITVPGALSQIFLNLVNNSCVHGFVGREQNRIDIAVSIDNDTNSYTITYQDNGHGMTEDVIYKVFEPFFTTKRGNGGSGLGMSIVYNLATQALQGEVSIDSKPDNGVTVTFKLPQKLT
ncbi:histidine kinase [Pseudoalteromonas sp. S4488]|uniref:GAF domain-containing sensor histidine kinase n=1 Tax=unclassified Pseudoalteromonas TaxID=194690 RepID=UPI001023A709|nr:MULTISPECIES: GAF domain-containing sensor histidine kinase [unclassified Pseudoalteromonas]RZF78982.1 sensor histidine kinase [Pseudoalteromonas sp. CO109Y]TMO31642.1 histidine kinase [Pseudoalteromonas sp. S4491]TMO35776.1 histidine kinase [Pseudoalteromonas sp. S4488]